MPDEFGFDHYIWQGDERLRTRLVRSVRPTASETNAAFERRMNEMVRQLAAMQGITRVGFVFERRAGRIVECLLDIEHTPRPSPVLEDDRLAGGRALPPRGSRSSAAA